MPSHTVADRVDAPVGRLEFPIDENAVAIVPNSCGLEAESVQHRPPPGADQHMATVDRRFGAGRFDAHRHGTAAVSDADDVRAAANDDAFSLEAIEKNGNTFRIVVRKRTGSLYHRHRTAEPAEGLGQFQ